MDYTYRWNGYVACSSRSGSVALQECVFGKLLLMQVEIAFVLAWLRDAEMASRSV